MQVISLHSKSTKIIDDNKSEAILKSGNSFLQYNIYVGSQVGDVSSHVPFMLSHRRGLFW